MYADYFSLVVWYDTAVDPPPINVVCAVAHFEKGLIALAKFDRATGKWYDAAAGGEVTEPVTHWFPARSVEFFVSPWNMRKEEHPAGQQSGAPHV